jgi:hypothetical protein
MGERAQRERLAVDLHGERACGVLDRAREIADVDPRLGAVQAREEVPLGERDRLVVATDRGREVLVARPRDVAEVDVHVGVRRIEPDRPLVRGRGSRARRPPTGRAEERGDRRIASEPRG